MIFHDSTKRNGFQNIKIKLTSTTWMTLECSVVIFQALEYLWPQWPQEPHQPQWPQWPRQPQFKKENYWVLCFHQPWHPNDLSWSLNVEWIIKNPVLLIFGTLSLGSCGGHPIRPKLNLKDKGQMSKPNEYTDNFKSNLTCIFLSVRAKVKYPLCPQTLCST
jgi:hypothetical protein